MNSRGYETEDGTWVHATEQVELEVNGMCPSCLEHASFGLQGSECCGTLQDLDPDMDLER